MADTLFDIYYEVENKTVVPATLVTQVELVVHDGDKLQAECTDPRSVMNAFEDEFFKRVTPANPTACRSEMETAYTEGLKAYDDVQKKNYIALASDLMSLNSVAEKIQVDCKPTKLVFE